MDVELRVERDADAAAAVVAELLAAASGNVVLTGGSTPRRAYELAAARRSDWTSVSFWWGDERCVPPDDELANYRMAHDALLGRAERLGPVHRMRGELPPAEGAVEYERELGETTFELLLLGIGPDGHVASLFPRAPTLEERTRRVISAAAGFEPFVPRITLTLPAIASAQQIVFLVAGAEKADAALRAFAEQPSPDTPASLARSRRGRTVAVLDRAAAARLDR